MIDAAIFIIFSCSLCESIKLEEKSLKRHHTRKKIFYVDRYTKMSKVQLFDANIMDKAIPSTSFSSEGAVPSISTVPRCD